LGTTTTTFNSNVDGSYIFESKLASMELHDRVTLESLFPTVMRSSTSLEAADNMGSDVFKFSLEKSRTGDQHLMLRLSAFEMVASQMLLVGVKQFFTLSGTSYTKKGAQQNATLIRSMSGSVDLFYDADDGAEEVHIFDSTGGMAAAKEKVSADTLSSALVDAWTNKTEEKKKWTMDCDIHAPVLIIPESCSSQEASVLVFDFGRLKFDYGRGRVEPKVKSWFDEQSHFSKKESIIDPGSIVISNLSFTIGKAGDLFWPQSTISASDIKDKITRSTVIEPLSGSLIFGVLSDPGRDVPSVCAYGVVPVVGLSISHAQISKVISVHAGWRDVISEFTMPESGEKKSADHEEEISEGVSILEQGTDGCSLSLKTLSSPSLIMQLNARRESMSSSPPSVRSPTKPKMAVDSALGEFVTMHVSMSLQRLSIRVLSHCGEGIEAHLVSVSASTSHKSDGSSLSRLRMGWFWLLDRFSYMLARKQRLIAHSTLPLSAAWFSEEGTYDILGTLRQRGVFDQEYSGSSELADITLYFRGSVTSTVFDEDPFSTDNPLVNAAFADGTLNAKFSSLYIHWNAHAVKVIIQSFSQTFESLWDCAANESLPKPPTAYSSAPAIFDESQTRTFQDTEGRKRSTMMISAELKSFEILLNSAKDDEALYIITIVDSSVQMLSSQCGDQSSMLVSLGLGDVRIAIPETSRTNPAYKTLLGLAPDCFDSLLSVKFSMGAEALQASDLEGVDPNKCDMCGEVTLSPMRLVCILAQILTLVDYINQEIVGVLTYQAASPSSDPTAVEPPQEIGKEKFFVVKATGLDVIVPRSASNPDYLAVRAGELVVNYCGYSAPGGGEAHLSLSGVTLEDSENQRMVNTKLRMTIDVIMPPGDIGTMDDRATRITINMFKVEFLLTQNQHQRIMWIMAENIGEADPCLRTSPDKLDLALQDGLSFDERNNDQMKKMADITYAGEEAVDVQNRMFVDFNMNVLSLELCGDDVSDPVVHFAALESNIAMKLLPDEETMTVKASVQDLTCDDLRLKAMDRPFRLLMKQVQSDAHDDMEKTRDIFCASYKKIGISSTEVDLKLGSPCIVFIPDVVSQVLQLLETEEKPDKGLTEMGAPKVVHAQNEAPQSNEKEVVEVPVQVDEDEESVEAAFVSLVQGRDSKSVTKIAIKTANCSVVFIDMGSATGPVPESHASFVAKSRSELMETIVFQGQFDAQTSYTSEIQSGRLVSANAEVHGECMEVYTAHGSNFAAPIQIVEPGSVSVFFTLKPGGENSKELDVRLVNLSPIDITLSMQNVALVNAIVSSCTECLDTDKTDHAGEAVVPLSEQEASKINALSSALENTDGFHRDESSVAQSVGDQLSISTRNDTEKAVSILTRVNVTMTETQVTIINDLQGLDEAMFRVSVSSFVAGGELRQGYVASTGSMKETTFYIQVNTALMADYFDPSLQLWVLFLKRPWETTLKCSREAGHRSSSERMLTIVDIDAFPCFLSFSEHFVVSLRAAIRMWSIYSRATTTAYEGQKKKNADVKEEVQGISRKALAATAARNIVTSLPYAVENHSGLDIHVMLPCSGERRSCQNGTLQYFRFEPPQGRGSGGHRCYGQDVTRLKAMNLFVFGRTIVIEDFDAELSRPRHVHVLGEGRYLVSHASKEGKTKVSSLILVVTCYRAFL
jgi:vacuolar protein sorting-associated protein 13A/C